MQNNILINFKIKYIIKNLFSNSLLYINVYSLWSPKIKRRAKKPS